eukprot:3165451-Alexandrium_andersonii.AAC.1
MPKCDASLLKCITSAGLWNGELLHAAGIASDPSCPFCGFPFQSFAHLWYTCPAFQHIREQFPWCVPALALALPPTLRDYGVAPL